MDDDREAVRDRVASVGGRLNAEPAERSTSSTLTSVSRAWVRLRKRDQRIRHLLPAPTVRRVAAVRSLSTELRPLYMSTSHKCVYDNLYHCGVQKTGSQWLMALLSDPVVYRYSGLRHYHPARQGDRLRSGGSSREAAKPIRPGRIVSPLRVIPEQFHAVPKCPNYRLFFVVRDPRDLIVSWYFSTLRTHIVGRDRELPLARARDALRSMSLEDGLHYTIDHWQKQGRFQLLTEWPKVIAADDKSCIVRYEDLVGTDQFREFRELFDWMDIPIPDTALRDLLADFSFSRLSGRNPGEENQRSHLRKASPGDWQGYFTQELLHHLEGCVGNLVQELGYE